MNMWAIFYRLREAREGIARNTWVKYRDCGITDTYIINVWRFSLVERQPGTGSKPP